MSMTSRFEHLNLPAGSFHLWLFEQPCRAEQSLLARGRWCVAGAAQARQHPRINPTDGAVLQAHLQAAQVVWLDAAAWHRYRAQLAEVAAPVVVISTDENVPEPCPPLVVTDDAAELEKLHALLTGTPSLRFALRRALTSGLSLTDGPWLIDGPCDSSYSLAIVNRERGRAFIESGQDIHWSDPEWLNRPVEKHFLTADECKRCHSHPGLPAVQLRNNYPPTVDDMGGRLNLYLNYAWEESGFPAEWIDGFNNRLDGMTVISTLVRDILRNNGLRIPVAVTGSGIDHLPPPADTHVRRDADGPFTFVHISSCFPRKGVDVLLNAWAQAFTSQDAVRLIIKTFHNPHNDTARWLDAVRAQYPDMAPVELIFADWPQEKIRALLQQADALVAPSRAEGFGMPLAEAMYYHVPVITTGWGGQRDFCNEDTAWLVDWRFARSRSHLATGESVWVEPDVDDLARRLREVATSTSEQLRYKTDRAYDLVTRRYRWASLAGRTTAFVRRLTAAPAFWPEPRVLWVSTFNSRCGIAEYSRNLLKAFPPGRYRVLTDVHSEPLGDDPSWVQRALIWSRDDINTIVQAAQDCDTVMLQHHHAFYTLDVVGELVQRLKAQGKQVFITFHNTHDPATGPDFSSSGLEQADRLLVHGVEDLNRLKRHGLVDNVVLFPLGVFEHPQDSVRLDTLRAEIGLVDKRVIASFGFLMPHKGIEELIRAFAQLAQHHGDLHLLLLNSYHPTAPSEEEKRRLDTLIDQLGLGERVTRRHDYLPEEEAIDLLRLAQVTAFPYRHTQESASAAVRMAIAAGRPIVVTPLPIFDDIAPIARYTEDMSVEALAEALADTLRDIESQGLDAVARPVTEWAAQRAWTPLSHRLWNLMQGVFLDRQTVAHDRRP